LAMVTAVAGRSDMATTLAALRRKSARAVDENISSDCGASGSSQSQLRPLLPASFAGFGTPFMIGLHGRPKKGGVRMLRNWYLTT
jgi:hypothetical protein